MNQVGMVVDESRQAGYLDGTDSQKIPLTGFNEVQQNGKGDSTP
jgi:hypothetical protein